MSFLEKLFEQMEDNTSATEAAEYCREGMQHYADNIITAIKPIEPDDLPYIVAVLDLCSEKLKNDIDANMMEFTEALKKVFKPCFQRVHLSID